MKTRIGDFQKYGIQKTKDGVMFTFSVSAEGECAILLYSQAGKKLVETVVIPEDYRIGDVYSVELLGSNMSRYAYLLSQDGETFVDPYAALILGRERWADASRIEAGFQVYGGIPKGTYQWVNQSPNWKPCDMIMYKLHMRGFTMSHGVGAGKKGNYKGVMELIPQLKEMGITTVELMPIYDFEEYLFEKRQIISSRGEVSNEVVPLDKMNYWGYGQAFYMAPKASYFGGKDAVEHCKEMMDAFHGAGIQVVLEMSFAAEMSEDYCLDCLHHWVKEYHVDGFHLLGADVPIRRIAASKLLATTNIFYNNIPEDLLAKEKLHKHLFLYNDGFMYVTRQIQNHMQGSMVQFTNHLRRQNSKYGFVNYIANTNGFTLWDSYSYGEKHNEANGEENRDGNNLNYSFNYGAEGPHKNKQIQMIRMKQMRNGLCATMLSQAVPLLCSGDEVANTQQGNNNPYCQDNPLGWVQFPKTKAKLQLLEFTKHLIAFRKEHPVVATEGAMKMADYKHVGVPDLSYHGYEPWLMGIGEEMRAIGILYSGAYGEQAGDNVYVAYNFHYDEVCLALPQVPDKKWSLVMNTSMESTFEFKPMEMENQRMITVPGESISILIS